MFPALFWYYDFNTHLRLANGCEANVKTVHHSRDKMT